MVLASDVQVCAFADFAHVHTETVRDDGCRIGGRRMNPTRTHALQEHRPGREAQFDFTYGNSAGVTVAVRPIPICCSS